MVNIQLRQLELLVFLKNKILFKSLELIVLTEIMFHDNTFKKVKIQENWWLLLH